MENFAFYLWIFMTLALVDLGFLITPISFARRGYEPQQGVWIGGLVGLAGSLLSILIFVPLVLMLIGIVADDLPFDIKFGSSNHFLPVSFEVEQGEVSDETAYSRAWLLGIFTFIGGLLLLNVLWRGVPDRREMKTVLPEGADLKRNTNARRIRGRVLGIHYLAAIVVAMFVLVSLVWNIVKTTFTATALQDTVDIKTLTDGRELEALSEEDMARVLVNNVPGQRIQTLVRDFVWGVDAQTAQDNQNRQLSEIIPGEYLYSDFATDLTYANLVRSPGTSRDLLTKNLNRDEIGEVAAFNLPRQQLANLIISRIAPLETGSGQVILRDFSAEDVNRLAELFIANGNQEQLTFYANRYAIISPQTIIDRLPELTREQLIALIPPAQRSGISDTTSREELEEILREDLGPDGNPAFQRLVLNNYNATLTIESLRDLLRESLTESGEVRRRELAVEGVRTVLNLETERLAQTLIANGDPILLRDALLRDLPVSPQYVALAIEEDSLLISAQVGVDGIQLPATTPLRSDEELRALLPAGLRLRLAPDASRAQLEDLLQEGLESSVHSFSIVNAYVANHIDNNYNPAETDLLIRYVLPRLSERQMLELGTETVEISQDVIDIAGGDTLPKLRLGKFELGNQLGLYVSGEILREILREQVWEVTPEEAAARQDELLVDIFDQNQIPRGTVDRLTFRELPAHAGVSLRFLAELNRNDLEQLVTAEVVKPRVVELWTLDRALFDRSGVEQELDDLNTRAVIERQAAIDAALESGEPIPPEYVQPWINAELEFRSWLNLDFITNTLSDEAELTGMRNAILGTLWMILMTILMAFPIGIGAAIYLEEYARDNFINRVIQTNIDNLAGVPSIIYGLLGVAVFVRLLEPLTSGSIFGYGDETTANGRTILSASMTMALLILPLIIINAQEAIRAVQPSIRQASFGLGATKWQTVWNHILPYSMPGILTGTILAISRAIGETAPLVVVGATVYVVRDPDSPFARFTALPVQIYNWTKEPRAADKSVAAAAIVVLLIILVMLNSIAIILRNRFERTRR